MHVKTEVVRRSFFKKQRRGRVQRASAELAHISSINSGQWAWVSAVLRILALPGAMSEFPYEATSAAQKPDLGHGGRRGGHTISARHCEGSKPIDRFSVSYSGGVRLALVGRVPPPGIPVIIRTVNQQFYRRCRARLDLSQRLAFSIARTGYNGPRTIMDTLPGHRYRAFLAHRASPGKFDRARAGALATKRRTGNKN